MTIAVIVVVIAVLVLVSETAAQSGSLGGIFDMSRLSAQQIAQFASDAGFSGTDLATAVAIALAESSGKPTAVGDESLAPTRGPSIGLWQINIGTHAHLEYDRSALMDPAYNAQAAYAVYEAAGYSFNPWSTFNPRDGSTPRYLAYLDTATAGVENV